MRNYTAKNILGEGATSVVYKAIDSNNNEVGIKMISKLRNSRLSIQKEVKMLFDLDHDNVLKYVDYYESNNNYYIVTELCDSSLINFINDYNIEESVALKILRMVLCGLQYIHSKGIIHRDIKLGNLLIKGNTVKICDFGLACYTYENNNTFCGTEDYLAPEVKSRKGYDKSIDIYSTGMVFYTLLTKRKYDGNIDHHISGLSRDLLIKMITDDPNKRIDALESLSHPVFDMFLPVFPVFSLLKDFSINEKFGMIEKKGNTMRFNEISARIEVNGPLYSDMNIFDLTNRSIRNVHILFAYAECSIKFTLEVDGKPRSVFLLTNSELKIINYGLAYAKLLIERLPVLVIEGVDYRFTYFLNKNFVYYTNSYVIKRKKGKVELTNIPSKACLLTKDISLQYSYDKLSFLSNKCDHLHSKIFSFMMQNTRKMTQFGRKMNTFWNESSIFPLTTTEDRLGVLFDLITNSKELPSVFKTDVSIPLSQTTMKCSYVDMSISKKYKYLFIDRIGWCIKNRTNFVFLMSDGTQIEIFGHRSVVSLGGREYAINRTLPKDLKRKLSQCLLFIKRMI